MNKNENKFNKRYNFWFKLLGIFSLAQVVYITPYIVNLPSEEILKLFGTIVILFLLVLPFPTPELNRKKQRIYEEEKIKEVNEFVYGVGLYSIIIYGGSYFLFVYSWIFFVEHFIPFLILILTTVILDTLVLISHLDLQRIIRGNKNLNRNTKI